MRAVVVRSHAGPEALELVEVPVPEAGPGQVRVRVSAAGVNPVDAVTRSGALVAAGLMAPREVTGLGWDVAGTVDRVGPGVSGFGPGDPVIGLRDRLDVPLGTYAEYVVLDASALAPAPAGVPAVEAATLPLNGLTAAQALDLLGLPAGASLLVTGAAGAVGGFAVELAALRGLRVVALAGAADEALVRGLGAEWFVPRGTADPAAAVRALVPGGVDGALDAALLGVVALGAVRNRGSFVTVSGGAPQGLRGIRVATVWIAADGPALAELSALAAAGRLTLRVAATHPLARAADAHRRLAGGGLRGRLVLVP
ncbi:NADP-dependent oxidoreductase [Kitasatospora sp. NPDC005751]|uniref:NADP-dependent oxidoreductase n=1 Tax=unclassified Kitasatospora TaxID=2633591 RepID=UPI0033C597E5